MIEKNFAADGFCLLRGAVKPETVERLLEVCDATLTARGASVRAKSSSGHVVAARNLIDSIPEVTTAWQNDTLLNFLRHELGETLGLVRALFFDKPPDRTWALPWHKDRAVAVKDNAIDSPSFSRPTLKAGVPHLIASDEVLSQMVTLRIHLDDVDEHNGPLEVVPGSHQSSGLTEDTSQSVKIFAYAGDVLAMRPLISHASGASTAGHSAHRRILHLEFSSQRELPGGIEWHDFIQPVVK